MRILTISSSIPGFEEARILLGILLCINLVHSSFEIAESYAAVDWNADSASSFLISKPTPEGVPFDFKRAFKIDSYCSGCATIMTSA